MIVFWTLIYVCVAGEKAGTTAFSLPPEESRYHGLRHVSFPERSGNHRITMTSAPMDDDEREQHMYNMARRLKLEVFDLDEGIFGFDSQDPRYGIEVIHTTIPSINTTGSIGLVLTEMAGNTDGRGLVLVQDVAGVAAQAQPTIQVGDVITGIFVGDTFRERTTALNYDRTVEVIQAAKEAARGGPIRLEINRLVPRAKIEVEVEDGETGEHVRRIQALAGENLRTMLLRNGIKLYNFNTKRFDMPYAKGDCAGEGMCGTCLVEVNEGAEFLNPKDSMEILITKGRPARWRASCRAFVGFDNKPGTLQITTKPQSNSKNELDPGVRSLQ